MKLFLVLLCFLVCFKASYSGLISQSSIQSCDVGDGNEPITKDGAGCKEKFVVSMTLKSGQGEREALYANINQVKTSKDSGLSSLKKPFRIEIQKSQTITNYRVYYRGSVNALPQELTQIFSRSSHCRDGWYEENTSCRKQRSLDGNGEFAWDSQGFCCKCSAYVREIRRSKGVCVSGISGVFKYNGANGYTTYYGNTRKSFGSSVHCMRMNDLWYDVYDIELPLMIYNISVRLLQYEGKIVDQEKGTELTNWTTLSTFYLSPSKTMGRSADGKIVVELQGDLVGANGPLDFSAKKLLIPSLKVWKLDKNPVPPQAYTNGPSDWLLVDEHLVDLSGKQCNKIGVSYTGFKRQNSPCDKPEHSCFTNQPLQLWEHDNALRMTGKPGNYMVYNFGHIHPSTHVTNHSFILRFINTDLHNSFVTFRIDASDIVFVYNAAKGRIVDAYATKFTAVKEVGRLFVEVENTGELESEYSVVLSECLGRQSTPSKVVNILPGSIANVSFSLQSYKTKGENSLCEVQLFDKSFNLLGTSKVDVTVKGACFCFGECGCSCGSGTTGMQGNSTALPCPTPPPVVISKRNLVVSIFFLVLESIGIHGIVGFFGSILLILGGIKLLCGGIICCRKTKAQEHYDNLIKKGVDPKSPALVKCTGECRGAKAALARYKRKVERLKRIGKNPGLLDDWRNTSYECNCRDELADIRFAYIIKAVCFYYYCCFLPFIWLGKKIWWTVFKDTAANKEAAKRAVLNEAKKKGKLEKYGIVDIQAELKNIETERNQLRGEGDTKQPQDTSSSEKNTKQTSATDGNDTKQTEEIARGNKDSKSCSPELISKKSKSNKKSKEKKLKKEAQLCATDSKEPGARTSRRKAEQSSTDKRDKMYGEQSMRRSTGKGNQQQPVPGKATKATNVPIKLKRPSKSRGSRTLSHGSQSIDKSETKNDSASNESLSPCSNKVSDNLNSDLAPTSQDVLHKTESDKDPERSSHTSLIPPDDGVERLPSDRSISPQQSRVEKGDSGNLKDSISMDKSKSDTCSRNQASLCDDDLQQSTSRDDITKPNCEPMLSFTIQSNSQQLGEASSSNSIKSSLVHMESDQPLSGSESSSTRSMSNNDSINSSSTNTSSTRTSSNSSSTNSGSTNSSSTDTNSGRPNSGSSSNSTQASPPKLSFVTPTASFTSGTSSNSSLRRTDLDASSSSSASSVDKQQTSASETGAMFSDRQSLELFASGTSSQQSLTSGSMYSLSQSDIEEVGDAQETHSSSTSSENQELLSNEESNGGASTTDCSSASSSSISSKDGSTSSNTTSDKESSETSESQSLSS